MFDVFFFFQAEDGIRDLVRSRGLGDVYKRQGLGCASFMRWGALAQMPLLPAANVGVLALAAGLAVGAEGHHVHLALDLSLIHI